MTTRYPGLYILAFSVIVGIVIAVLLYALGALSSTGNPFTSRQPTSSKVVQAFRENNLEVGNSYSVEQDPTWAGSPVPKTYKDATRFEIPSMGQDKGGHVFTFDSASDMKPVQDYYQGFSGAFYSYVYVNKGKNILVQINGELPKKKAQQYENVLQKV